jgi:hypothetical protein
VCAREGTDEPEGLREVDPDIKLIAGNYMLTDLFNGNDETVRALTLDENYWKPIDSLNIKATARAEKES